MTTAHTAERLRFLRDICLSPDEDVPRLMFADWLQEHEEDDRAEFIRVQVELKRVRDESGFTTLQEEDLSHRESIIIAVNPQWSSATCPECELWTVSTRESLYCPTCEGIGDLLKRIPEPLDGVYLDMPDSEYHQSPEPRPIIHIRGLPHTEATLAECVRRVQGMTGTLVRTVPSPWLLAVCKTTDVVGVRLVDLYPVENLSGRWSNDIPEFLKEFVKKPFTNSEADWDLSLAYAVVAWVRAYIAQEPT